MATESQYKTRTLPAAKRRPIVHDGLINKRVKFYISGERFYSGYEMVITPRRFRYWYSLLDELSRVLIQGENVYRAGLAQGVNHIFNLSSGEEAVSLEDLQDGKAYICSSFNKFKRMKYDSSGPVFDRRIARKVATRSGQQSSNNSSDSESVTLEKSKAVRYPAPAPRYANTQSKHVKPRKIRVIRHGARPRRVVNIVLSKRTAQNLDQVLNEITMRTASTAVRHLYDTQGQLVQRISDLFKDETVFIAVGIEKIKYNEIAELLKELEHHEKPSINRNRHRVAEQDHGKTTKPTHLPDIPTNKQSGDRYTGNKGQPRTDKINSNSNTPRSIQTNNTTNNTAVGNNQPPKPAPNGYISTGQAPKDAKGQPQKGTHKVENKPSSESLGHSAQNKPQGNKTESQKREEDERLKLPSIGNIQHIVTSPTRRSVDETKKSVDQNNESNKADQENKPISNKVISKRESKKKLIENKESHSNASKVNSLKGEEKKEENTKTISVEKKLPPKPQKVEDVYEFGKKIGDGNFAVVREATHKLTKRNFAIKIIDRAKVRDKEKMVKNEIQIMKRCSHPNIVRLFESYDTPTDIYLVMELIKGGDLFDAIAGSTKFAETLARSYVRDIAKALHYLHKQLIVHRDLKPENLLVLRRTDGSTYLKLADFGLAMKVEGPIFTVCGTPTYVAPEILKEEGYELKVDMWATGVITYIMLCGFPPFRSPERRRTELFSMIEDGDYEFVSPYWDSVSDDAMDLVSALLVVEPKNRYSAVDVLKHPWVRLAGGSRSEILESPRGEEAKKRFKAAGLAVQSVKKLQNLVDEFHHRRGEELLV